MSMPGIVSIIDIDMV